MNKSNSYKPNSEKEDLLTNPNLSEKTIKQRSRIDYSNLRKIGNLEPSSELGKTDNSRDQISERVFQEVFKPEVCANELIQRMWNRIARNKIIRITRVDFLFKTSDFVNLHDFWGMWIDSPLKGIQASNSSILIAGWVLGKKQKVSRMKVLLSEEVIGESLINSLRPDVAGKYFFVPDAYNSGFCISLDLDNLPSQGHILIQAVLADSSSLVIGAIQYCKY